MRYRLDTIHSVVGSQRKKAEPNKHEDELETVGADAMDKTIYRQTENVEHRTKNEQTNKKITFPHTHRERVKFYMKKKKQQKQNKKNTMHFSAHAHSHKNKIDDE